MSEVQYSTYRVSTTVQRAFWLAIAVGTVSVLGLVFRDDTLSGPGRITMLAGFAVVIALIVAWAYRSATVTSAEHLIVRGLIRTRRIPWSQVQTINIEINVGSVAQKDAPKRIVAVYDATGRRTVLPHLHDKGMATFDHEVERLQTVWRTHRGEGWVRIPSALVRADELQRYGLSSGANGLSWAMITFAVMIVLFVVCLLADVTVPSPLASLFTPAAVAIVPTVVLVAVTFGSWVLRRRARAGRPENVESVESDEEGAAPGP